jgi:hypothetical protein
LPLLDINFEQLNWKLVTVKENVFCVESFTTGCSHSTTISIHTKRHLPNTTTDLIHSRSQRLTSADLPKLRRDDSGMLGTAEVMELGTCVFAGLLFLVYIKISV